MKKILLIIFCCILSSISSIYASYTYIEKENLPSGYTSDGWAKIISSTSLNFLKDNNIDSLDQLSSSHLSNLNKAISNALIQEK